MRLAGEVIWYEVMTRAEIPLHDPAVIRQRDRVMTRRDDEE